MKCFVLYKLHNESRSLYFVSSFSSYSMIDFIVINDSSQMLHFQNHVLKPVVFCQLFNESEESGHLLLWQTNWLPELLFTLSLRRTVEGLLSV